MQILRENDSLRMISESHNYENYWINGDKYIFDTCHIDGYIFFYFQLKSWLIPLCYSLSYHLLLIEEKMIQIYLSFRNHQKWGIGKFFWLIKL